MLRIGNIKNRHNGKVIDITVKNNPGHILAPTWKMVLDFKNKRMTWEEYEQQYYNLVIGRLKTRMGELLEIIYLSEKEDITLVCFCKDETRCHRTLAKNILFSLKACISTKV